MILTRVITNFHCVYTEPQTISPKDLMRRFDGSLYNPKHSHKKSDDIKLSIVDKLRHVDRKSLHESYGSFKRLKKRGSSIRRHSQVPKIANSSEFLNDISIKLTQNYNSSSKHIYCDDFFHRAQPIS